LAVGDTEGELKKATLTRLALQVHYVVKTSNTIKLHDIFCGYIGWFSFGIRGKTTISATLFFQEVSYIDKNLWWVISTTILTKCKI